MVGFPERHPIKGFEQTIIVASGTSEKEEDVTKNTLLTDLYFWGPQLATASKEATLDFLDEDDNVVYSTGACDFSSALAASRRHPIHLQRGIMGTTTIKVTTDANVGADRTFYVTARGLK